MAARRVFIEMHVDVYIRNGVTRTGNVCWRDGTSGGIEM